MLSILIADDESSIIDLIKMLIVYPHVQIVGEARNSEEALRLIEEKQPNLVITDICMPGISGLDMIEQAKSRHPGLEFIVVSGYRNFEYAQTALRFGVNDYLLKPIKKNELNHLLEKIDDKLSKAGPSDEMRQHVENSIRALRKNYVASLLALAQSHFSEHGEAGPRRRSVPLLASKTDGAPIFHFADGPSQCFLLKIDLLDETVKFDQVAFIMENLCLGAYTEALKYCSDAEYHVQRSKALFIVNFRPAEKSAREALIRALRQIIRALNFKFAFIHVTASLSAPFPFSWEGFETGAIETVYACMCRVELRHRELIEYDARAFSAVARQISQRGEGGFRKLSMAVENLDAQDTADAVSCLWRDLVGNEPMPGLTTSVVFQCLEVLHARLPVTPDIEQAVSDARSAFFLMLEGGTKHDELCAQTQAYIGRLLTMCKDAVSGKEIKQIRDAKEYVLANYASNITLAGAAAAAELSPNYFSAVFKAQTGQGFLSYVQSIRIEEAKHLLRATQMGVGEVARQVGYDDVKHFTKLFIKETGIKPTEYRKFYS